VYVPEMPTHMYGQLLPFEKFVFCDVFRTSSYTFHMLGSSHAITALLLDNLFSKWFLCMSASGCILAGRSSWVCSTSCIGINGKARNLGISVQMLSSSLYIGFRLKFTSLPYQLPEGE
jgi:hypothetical protein